MFPKIFKQILRHKLLTGIILLLVIGSIYFGYQKLAGNKNAVRYATAAVEKGTLVVSVSGSGQVTVLDQVDIKPKVSGEVSAIYVEKGDEVKTGKLILKLDDTDFQKAVRDAETSLETAKLELEKLLEPPDELALLQAENSLAQAKETKQKTEDNLEKAYEDGFNTVANAFLDLPTVMAGLQDILFGDDFSRIQSNINYYTDTTKIYDERVFQYEKDAYDRYQLARKAYDQNFADYKSASRYSDKVAIEELINQTYETTKSIAEAVKSANNLIQFYKDKLTERDLKPNPLADTHLSSLNTYTGKTNSHLLNLLSIKRTIEDNKESILNAERSIEEKEKSLAKLKAGPDGLDIRAKKIAVQQKEDNLLTAKENLAKCFIYAPFNGLISDIKVKKGDSVSSGTALATLITEQKIAEISLNEVDAAKVKTGQKATLTFDALPEVTISGKILEVDTVGTVSQGVVSYGVKIAFDTQDERIKPGMSATADIITDAKQDILVLPNSAIKSQGNSYYVELVEASEEMRQQLLANVSGTILPKPPKQQQVETGLSNDLSTEIVSGLKEGDIVVTSTISSNKVQTTQTQSNRSQGTQEFRIPGL